MRRAPVAVDAMGGDLAPRAIVSGAIAAARRGIAVVLVGPSGRIRLELARHRNLDDLPMTVVNAPDVVTMAESPLAALRRKPHSSIAIATGLVAAGRASAVFSAGHTGAALLAAHAAFGMLPGVERPALAVILPARTGRVVLLDAGANAECRVSHLRQFARMGAAYARVALGIAAPRIGLLSIGEEAGKGNDLVKQTHTALVSAPIDFIGNVEARDLFSGRADVVVCDGFTGNIALKIGEGVVETVEVMLRDVLGARFDRALPPATLRRFRSRVDYAEHGAAPLLGVNGLALVGHGRSSPRAVQNGIMMAATLAGAKLVERLAETMASPDR